MKEKIGNIKDLRDNLVDELANYYASDKGNSNLDRLGAVAKASATIIRTAKLELEYAKYKGRNIEIPFLSVNQENN